MKTNEPSILAKPCRHDRNVALKLNASEDIRSRA